MVDGQPVVDEGGGSETDFAILDDGGLVAVERDEAGSRKPPGGQEHDKRENAARNRNHARSMPNARTKRTRGMREACAQHARTMLTLCADRARAVTTRYPHPKRATPDAPATAARHDNAPRCKG